MKQISGYFKANKIILDFPTELTLHLGILAKPQIKINIDGNIILISDTGILEYDNITMKRLYFIEDTHNVTINYENKF